MRCNGTIRFKRTQEGRFDSNGYPVVGEAYAVEPPQLPPESFLHTEDDHLIVSDRCAIAEWSEPVPCQIVPVNGNLLARSNGEAYSKFTYTVFLEEQPIAWGERVMLADDRGNLLGEYSLATRPRFLRAVGQIKILV